jgi:hypothetical protein
MGKIEMFLLPLLSSIEPSGEKKILLFTSCTAVWFSLFKVKMGKIARAE